MQQLSSAQLSSVQLGSAPGGSCRLLASQAPCETSGVWHLTSAMGFSNTTGLRGDASGLALYLTRGNKTSTDDFCYRTCTKVSTGFRSQRNQNTLQGHA